MRVANSLVYTRVAISNNNSHYADCVYVVYLCSYVCMYVCMYVWTHLPVSMCVCVRLCKHLPNPSTPAGCDTISFLSRV